MKKHKLKKRIIIREARALTSSKKEMYRERTKADIRRAYKGMAKELTPSGHTSENAPAFDEVANLAADKIAFEDIEQEKPIYDEYTGEVVDTEVHQEKITNLWHAGRTDATE